MGNDSAPRSTPADSRDQEGAQSAPSAAPRQPAPPRLLQEADEPIWARPIFDNLLLSDENIPPEEPASFQVEYGLFGPVAFDELSEASGRADRVPGPAQAAQPERSAASGDGWEEMYACYEEGRRVKARVISCNKGGLLVALGDLQGFVPASQLVHFPRHLDATARERFLEEQKECELDVQVIEIDRERNRLVLSERACVLDQDRGERLLETLQSGDVVQGLVSNLCDFGAFVDLGGIDGLIHVSEIAWQRVGHPQDVLKIGEPVQVHVLSVDREKKRIALSLKRLKQDPWRTVEQKYHVGQIVTGVVTNIVDFGVFARIEEGLEGLVHVSELISEGAAHPRELVREGQALDLYILRIDGENRRLGLSLRQALNHGAPWAAEADRNE
ncbi:MAG: S1 RNA-binding domain-containing protein [Chloroflexi bacterium]|nr:S1 RNA-binding domain-containing protein [Chloroflexota bacterium]